MKIYFKGRKIYVDARKVGTFGKIRGLMFRRRNCDNLFFDKAEAIHSWFVFFSFLAVWLDSKNKVVGFEIIRPFRSFVKVKGNAEKLIEAPFNKKNERLILEIVGRKV